MNNGGHLSTSWTSSGAQAAPSNTVLTCAVHAGIAPQTTSGDGADGMAALTGGSESEHKEVRARLAAAYERHIAPAVKLDICARETTALPAGSAGGHASSARRRASSKSSSETWTTGWWTQFLVLVQRGLKERRHESFNKLRVFQVLSVATLAGLLWWAHPGVAPAGPDSAHLLLLRLLGLLPALQRRVHVPAGAAHAGEGAVVRDVPPLLLPRRAPPRTCPWSWACPRRSCSSSTGWAGWTRAGTVPPLLAVVLYSVLVAQSLGLAIGAVLMDVKQGTTLAPSSPWSSSSPVGTTCSTSRRSSRGSRWLNYSFYCYRLLLGIQFPNGGGYYDCDGHGKLCPSPNSRPSRPSGSTTTGSTSASWRCCSSDTAPSRTLRSTASSPGTESESCRETNWFIIRDCSVSMGRYDQRSALVSSNLSPSVD
ncbi:unnamed protein product [Miscanthus lutarioriparius]|uniref:Uncharacterized protein n=1 Tax=Miscanthus lutarioriparius TaxID=422564 RepID=A0A811SE83_9POAL|nr:unnamed protein product [Miscanthus lutarioriparius]